MSNGRSRGYPRLLEYDHSRPRQRRPRPVCEYTFEHSEFRRRLNHQLRLGRTPGVDDVKLVSATVTINGESRSSPTRCPWTSAGRLKHFVGTNPRTVVNLVKQSNGLYKFRYGNSGSSNVDDLGIYWQFSRWVGRQLAMVQVMTAGLYVYVDSNDVYHSALWERVISPRRQSSRWTLPWYNGQGNPLEGSDSPSFEFPSTNSRGMRDDIELH